MNASQLALPINCAAASVRMSTEHQQCSTGNQLKIIKNYAKRRGLEIVKQYSDEEFPKLCLTEFSSPK